MTASPQASRLSVQRRRPLAAFVTAAIVATVPGDGIANVPVAGQAAAATVVVQNCNDSGAGSLRAAFANAVDNELIDLTTLTCSRITLGSALVDPVAATNVTLRGPGKDLLAIDGDGLYRVLVHRGTGGLHVDQLTIANGRYAGARGGCIYSAGGVEATGTLVTSCVLETDGLTAYGGGIYAKDTVSLFDSAVTDSSATTAALALSQGGGIYSAGIVMARSTISGNSADRGAGIHVAGLLYIEDSTLSRNHATTYGGAIEVTGRANHTIRNSTISANSAGDIGGAIYGSSLNIYNCTIAFNTRSRASAGGAGLFVGASTIDSSIIANNTSGDGLVEDDLLAYDTVTGADNLIMASSGPVTAGRITVDPNLGPLQDNGGPTRTHALLPGSPAIGRGSNISGLDSDQRGLPFRRVDGARADIGAFEFSDALFRDGLEPEA